jgi:hypothetical protein
LYIIQILSVLYSTFKNNSRKNIFGGKKLMSNALALSTIYINDHQLKIKEFKGQKVVSFKDIDDVHERPEGTAKRNFIQNRKHFIENEDFYIIKAADLQKDEIRTFEITSPRGKTMVTESGYLMLVKSFTDDLAWEVQRQLVKNYFRAKTMQEIDGTAFEMLRLVKDIQKNVNQILLLDNNLITKCSDRAFKCIVNGTIHQICRIFCIRLGDIWGELYGKIFDGSENIVAGKRLDYIAKSPLLRSQLFQDILNLVDKNVSKKVYLLPSSKMNKKRRNEQIYKMKMSGMKYQAIADKYGLSRQRVYQIVSVIKKKEVGN